MGIKQSSIKGSMFPSAFIYAPKKRGKGKKKNKKGKRRKWSNSSEDRLAVRRVFHNSPHWRMVRQQVLERDNQQCFNRCSNTDKLVVHHVHYRTLGEEKPDELVTLCTPCHDYEHQGQRLSDREAYWLRKIAQRQSAIDFGTRYA